MKHWSRMLFPSWLLLIYCLVQTAAQAEFNYEARDGEIVITKYTGSGGAISIPSSLNDLTVIGIGDGAFQFCTNVTSVVIPDSVVTLGNEAFNGCGSLTNVIIPDSVTTMGASVFSGTKLRAIKLPNRLPSIAYGAFYDCTSLVTIAIPNSVTSIGDAAFYFCTNMTRVLIGENVKRIGNNSFQGCYSLNDLIIPGSVTNIGTQGFGYCFSNLTSIQFVGNAPAIGQDVFIGNNNLTVYHLPGTTGWGLKFGERPTAIWMAHQGALKALPSYQYDGARGPHTITEAHVGADGRFSFVFATTNVGARCVVSWTTTLSEWFAFLDFDANTVGTELSGNAPAPQTFYRATYLPAGVSSAEGFDYPIGRSAFVPEQITPEKNNIYPNGPITKPVREAISPTTEWRNAQDVGSYYVDYSGLHPGEDWNNGSKSDADVGESIRAVANGQVVEIRPVSASGAPKATGYAMVIRHWLINGDSVDSLYLHLAPDRNNGLANIGGVIGDKNDFTYQVGTPVTKGTIIGVIGSIEKLAPHLHFEMRNKALDITGPLWPNSTGNGYYGPEPGSTGKRSPTMNQADVEATFRLMQADGIIDPSDFIDDHRR